VTGRHQGECGELEAHPPCAVVIFGASGDLAYRKLVPALFSLMERGVLDPRSIIVGTARTPYTDESFRERMSSSLREAGAGTSGAEAFVRNLCYVPIDYTAPESYARLARRIEALEDEGSSRRRRIFNLALPPSLYGPVAEKLGEAGLADEEASSGGWSRLIVEKPFGRDLESAMDLNGTLARWFSEKQVFRIDHFMTKETVQNILVFRFANAIFEPLWNRNYIEYVRINASESLGIEDRAGYYEEAGVIRDMLQNHLMQLLALVAMEPPARFDAERLRDKQAELFRVLRRFPLEDARGNLALGQYGAGTSDGRQVGSYREEEGVAPDSKTPTYALMKVFLDNWRWQGVPFFLSSGKRLRRKVSRIDIQFRAVPHSMFPPTVRQDLRANRLVLGIQPEEDIFLDFQAKKPGPSLCLRTVGLKFGYGSAASGTALDAYAKAIMDAVAGDQTLFWRRDCLEHCWAYFDDLVDALDACGHGLCDLETYESGSWGPSAALEMLPADSWPEKPQ
jgi:glucose-6-phosphate 1-dehydrogenase